MVVNVDVNVVVVVVVVVVVDGRRGRLNNLYGSFKCSKCLSFGLGANGRNLAKESREVERSEM
ncbi:hypothetical protein WMF31_40695 [Sorangium sp. So ce1036]|uniref:hypothetical protein n=1 Tax=Sorangium sp. So ce1036 TaxID=3133328 RepID=UPI003F0C48BD